MGSVVIKILLILGIFGATGGLGKRELKSGYFMSPGYILYVDHQKIAYVPDTTVILLTDSLMSITGERFSISFPVTSVNKRRDRDDFIYIMNKDGYRTKMYFSRIKTNNTVKVYQSVVRPSHAQKNLFVFERLMAIK